MNRLAPSTMKGIMDFPSVISLPTFPRSMASGLPPQGTMASYLTSVRRWKVLRKMVPLATTSPLGRSTLFSSTNTRYPADESFLTSKFEMVNLAPARLKSSSWSIPLGSTRTPDPSTACTLAVCKPPKIKDTYQWQHISHCSARSRSNPSRRQDRQSGVCERSTDRC